MRVHTTTDERPAAAGAPGAQSGEGLGSVWLMPSSADRVTPTKIAIDTGAPGAHVLDESVRGEWHLHGLVRALSAPDH